MSDFSGMEELLQDFLQESSELLDDVDSKLLMLEQAPHDHGLLNDIFRGFHTIKGGAGFLNATELVTLCHLTENLFDRLRNDQLALDANIMDAILSATSEVRHMFGALSQNTQPSSAPPAITQALEAILEGKPLAKATPASAPASPPPGPDWNALFAALTSAGTPPEPLPPAVPHAQDKPAANAPPPSQNLHPTPESSAEAPQEIRSYGRRATDSPANASPGGRRESENVKENTIRVDTERLDQVLNLSGEIGLTKNRLNQLRSDILLGKQDANTLRALDEAVNQLDMLVVSLQNSVMKTRMQPIGRLFKKFPLQSREDPCVALRKRLKLPMPRQ